MCVIRDKQSFNAAENSYFNRANYFPESHLLLIFYLLNASISLTYRYNYANRAKRIFHYIVRQTTH